MVAVEAYPFVLPTAALAGCICGEFSSQPSPYQTFADGTGSSSVTATVSYTPGTRVTPVPTDRTVCTFWMLLLERTSDVPL